MRELIQPHNNMLPVMQTQLAQTPISANTRRAYGGDLARFEAWRDGRPLSKLLVEAYITEQKEAGKAPSTISRSLAAVRWWARRLVDLAYEVPLPDDPQEREAWRAQREEIVIQSNRITSIPDPKGHRETQGRAVHEGEFRELLAACAQDQTPAGVRDRALLALVWSSGMRRTELAGLGIGDLSPLESENGPAFRVLVKGKGDKERVNYLYNGATLCLEEWLAARGQEPGPVFCRIRRGGHVKASQSLSGEALRLLLENRRQQAGVPALTWHDFRRTLVGDLLERGYDLVTIGNIVGHSSKDTTAGYDRRSDETQRRALRERFVPYMQMRLERQGDTDAGEEDG